MEELYTCTQGYRRRSVDMFNRMPNKQLPKDQEEVEK